MEEAQRLPPDESWPIIVQKIKEKYESYCLKDGKTYPPLSFNWTAEPYQHLIDSFKVELHTLLPGKSEAEIRDMIPSDSLFAKIFRNNYQPKGKKLRGCYLYATGKSNVAFEKEYRGLEITPSETIEILRSVATKQPAKRLVIIGCLVCLVGLSLFIWRRSIKLPPSGLIIERPVNGKVVSMEVLAEGKVSNANTVWIVIRYFGGVRYWVQPPIKVAEDGTWKGPIFVGENNAGDIGLKSQIRAFVNPVKPLKGEEILYSWPKAELSSQAIEVVRGSENTAHTSGLVIEWPINGKTVPHQLLAEGKASNANIVWIVILDVKHSVYYVQPPIKVNDDGTWKGPVYIGGNNKAHIGAQVKIRAFVNPIKPLKEGEVLYSWPEAQLSSKIIRAIRG